MRRRLILERTCGVYRWRWFGLVLVSCGLGACSSESRAERAGDGAPVGPDATVPSADPASTAPGASAGPGLLPPDQDLIDQSEPTSGEPAECARDTYEGDRVEVNLYLLLDISGSMTAPISVNSDQTQWDAVRTAVTGFIESPESAGLNLALNYFPRLSERTNCSSSGTCASDAGCVERVCDLRFVVVDVLSPCDFDAQCGLVLEFDDGTTLPEGCSVPGRCSNDPFELCFIDQQCEGGGVCQASDVGLCPGQNSCASGEYEAPAVDKGTLPDLGPALVESLLGHEPDAFGLTPTHAALQGVYDRVGEWIEDEPNTRSIVVLATDGAPRGCFVAGSLAEEDDLAREATYDTLEAAAARGIETYVIGVLTDLTGVDEETRQQIEPTLTALASQLDEMARLGGTEFPYNVSVNENAAQAFIQALAEIRGQVLPCEYVLPRPAQGPLVFDKVNIEWTRGDQNESVPKVSGLGGCLPGENAWYYNVDETTQTPTRIVLCPDTCEQVNAADSSQIDIVLGCDTIVSVR